MKYCYKNLVPRAKGELIGNTVGGSHLQDKISSCVYLNRLNVIKLVKWLRQPNKQCGRITEKRTHREKINLFCLNFHESVYNQGSNWYGGWRCRKRKGAVGTGVTSSLEAWNRIEHDFLCEPEGIWHSGSHRLECVDGHIVDCRGGLGLVGKCFHDTSTSVEKWGAIEDFSQRMDMTRSAFWKDHPMTMWLGIEQEQGEDESRVDILQILEYFHNTSWLGIWEYLGGGNSKRSKKEEVRNLPKGSHPCLHPSHSSTIHLY